MRTTTISISLLTVALLTMGCPGRGTPTTESPESETGRLPGVASFTADMLRRGAGDRTAEEIANEIAFVGGDLSVQSRRDYTVVQVRVLRDHLDLAMGLLADLSQRPTFTEAEIETIRARELNRLVMMQKRPRWLANQAFYRSLYGAGHPYGFHDSHPAAIAKLSRDYLTAFHQEHFVPRNSFLLATGDVDQAAMVKAAQQHFGGWADRPAPDHSIPEPQPMDSRRIVVVDRPGATQAEIYVGNLAVNRSHPEYIRLRVANQILGGSASARLFMNLRERCSYSYGVYSTVYSLSETAPHVVSGAVEAQHTAGALREIFSELDRIRQTEPPTAELDAAQSYIVGHFPITNETLGNISELVTVQRVFGLSEDYWDTYRSSIAAVTGDEAQEAAQTFIDPDHALVVIVGDASQVAEPARRYGAVTIFDAAGNQTGTLEAAPGQWPGGEPPLCEDNQAEEAVSRSEEPPTPAEARDMDFPDVHEATLDNGLQVLTIERNQLPMLYLRLVIRSGSASDPVL